MHLHISSLLALICISFNVKAQTTFAEWRFNSETIQPTVGTSVLTLTGDVSEGYVNGASGDTGAPNRALKTSSYPSQETNNASAGIALAVDATNYKNISLNCYSKSSNTASRYFAIQLSENLGETWVNLDTNQHSTSFENYSVILPDSIKNQTFQLRYVSIFEPGLVEYTPTNADAYKTNGTVTFDLISFSGELVEEEPENACNFPLLESFSNSFQEVNPIIPDWNFEQVQSGSTIRYSRNTSDFYSSPASLAITPVSNYDFYGTWDISGANCERSVLSFWLGSKQNSTGTRPSLVTVKVFAADTLAYQSIDFSVPNATTTFSLQNILLPSFLAGAEDLNMQFWVRRDEDNGSGSSATVLIDDVQIEQVKNAPFGFILEASKIDGKTIEVSTSKPFSSSDILNVSRFNSPLSIASVTSQNGTDTIFRITFSDNLPLGNFTLAIQGLLEANGTSVFPDFIFSTYTPNNAIPSILITEIMYNPPESGSDTYEYIEIYNHGNASVQLSKFYFDGIDFTFPDTSIEAKSTFVLVKDSTAFSHAFQKSFCPFSGTLSNSGETITLLNEIGETIHAVNYKTSSKWPQDANGNGSSMEMPIELLGFDANEGETWQNGYLLLGTTIDGTLYGSPGFLTRVQPTIVSDTVILPYQLLVQLSRPFLSSSVNQVVLDGTIGEFSSVEVGNNDSLLVFTFDTTFLPGLYSIQISQLKETDGNDYPAITGNINVQNTTTPNITLSEIMYNPPESGSDKYEFIEIYNYGASPAYLHDLTFTAGIEYTLPDTVLLPKQTLLIAEDADDFFSVYGIPALEWTGGSLSNSGEAITLANSLGSVVFSITYDDSGDWTKEADGGGSSLALDTAIAFSNVNEPASWFAPNQFAGMIDNIAYYATPGYLSKPKIPIIFTAGDTILLPEGIKDFSIPVFSKYAADKPAKFSLKITSDLADTSDYSIDTKGHQLSLPTGKTALLVSLTQDQINAETDEFLAITLVPESNAEVLAQETFWIQINNVKVPEHSPNDISDICCFIPERPLYFPSPVEDVLHFYEMQSGVISNLLGMSIQSFVNVTEINLTHLPSGTYMLVTTKGRAEKIIKK